MHILIGLAMAAALLYFWLLGHWFARILVFLCLLGFPVILGLAVSADKNEAGAQIGGLVVFIISAVVVWLVASIPIYYWRYRLGCPASSANTSNTSVRHDLNPHPCLRRPAHRLRLR